MIEVEKLTKRYGPIRAIREASFSVGKGEVVGFLGPNGAGKTTTMRILTTYLLPSSGRARLAGFDVLDEPLAVRKSVGYLPESVPLYPEMRTAEFLGYRAKLKDVPRRKRRSVLADVMQRCGLEEVGERVVGNLSKGYKQRVGLADALLNDPPILILDEPTSGLDPLQIREVRGLIRELGERHTILISTHIMPEVEAVCSRVLIVAGGRIALDESIEGSRETRSILIEARGPAETVKGLLETTPGVARVRAFRSEGEETLFEVVPASGAKGEELREALAKRVVQSGWGLRRLELARSTLEERFVEAVRAAMEADEGGPDDPGREAA
jgi:ABC-2 type transport system ATP-binding protein